MVHPLVHDEQRALHRMEMADRILGQYSQTVGIDHFRDAMVDLRIHMVGTACQHDATAAGLLHVFQGFLTLAHDILAGMLHFRPALLGCLADLILGDAAVPGKFCNKFIFQNGLVLKGQEWVKEIDVAAGQLVDVIFDVLRVGGDDGAVIVVARIRELSPLIGYAGVEDELQALTDEPGHMTVGQLSRVALRLAGNGLNTHFVNLMGGRRGEYHPVAQIRKEREPERIVLIEIQNTGDTHSSALRSFLR